MAFCEKCGCWVGWMGIKKEIMTIIPINNLSYSYTCRVCLETKEVV